MTRDVRNGPLVVVRPPTAVDGKFISRPVAAHNPAWLRLAFAAAFVIAIAVGLVMLQEVSATNQVHRLGLVTGLLTVTSLVATVAYLVIMTALHVLPTGFSPIRHAVSDYGVGRYRSLFTVALYVSSVGVLTLAYALLRAVGSPPLVRRDIAYLLLIPLARIGMTMFPTSLEGQRLSRTGALHYACAVAAFTLTYLTISGMTPVLRTLDPTGWAHAPLGLAAWIVVPALALVVITLLGPLRRFFGLFERVFLFTTNIWFGLAASLLVGRLR